MIDEARAFSEMRSDATGHEFRVGVSAGPGALPSWKREADYLFAQVRYSIDDFMRWRSSIDFDGPVYAGVMLVPTSRWPERSAPRFVTSLCQTVG